MLSGNFASNVRVGREKVKESQRKGSVNVGALDVHFIRFEWGKTRIWRDVEAMWDMGSFSMGKKVLLCTELFFQIQDFSFKGILWYRAV